MPERADIPFTGEHFAAWCLRMQGQPFWYGCCAYKATTDLLRSKITQYPGEFTADRLPRCREDIRRQTAVCDCIGAAKGYAWTGGGQTVLEAIGTDRPIPIAYASNGCPDKNADGMFAWARELGQPWGEIAALPEHAGLALYKPGHTGYTVGGGWAVEWPTFEQGCVMSEIARRDFTHWYALPFIQYVLP